MEKTNFAEISALSNAENGEVTLFVSNAPWGPVVTGKNLSDAKAKMKEAFGISMIANSYCDPKNNQNIQEINERFSACKKEMDKMNHTLEHSYN